ncbi:hypothetical protein [Flavilitoribacter nigricans]|uniref:Uncharacterized protein n=1 Tax=Flavilitoribacter nigricans (strain ATCC 23147 / DSM 23189 / NBRC 102662 / NCIMB 1420 / SS-2) TaxID=1122177 RepID=A0A2D0NCD2_FLAN2|nr:hypothetical protein [Flavilitoribacter nigricans]PHN06161.1 hypothetical protein CRP01_11290 [Flavilitoribacter nigricans DSM 23189 = NBRC 102662]
MDAATYKNRAVSRLVSLKDGFQSTMSRPKLTVDQVAAMSALRGGDAKAIEQTLPQKESEHKMLLKSAGIALALILLFVLAVKYKFIKL